MLEKIINIIYRIMFILTGIFIVLALWERILNQFNYTLSWLRITYFTLLELSGILAIFVMTLLLRQIRNLLRKS